MSMIRSTGSSAAVVRLRFSTESCLLKSIIIMPGCRDCRLFHCGRLVLSTKTFAAIRALEGGDALFIGGLFIAACKHLSGIPPSPGHPDPHAGHHAPPLGLRASGDIW